MAPSATPKRSSAHAWGRASVQRQGRQMATRISAAKPTRNAEVPWAPSTGKSCLAREVPTPSAVTEPSTASRRSEEHTSELQSQSNLVCRLLLEKKKQSH